MLSEHEQEMEEFIKEQVPRTTDIVTQLPLKYDEQLERCAALFTDPCWLSTMTMYVNETKSKGHNPALTGRDAPYRPAGKFEKQLLLQV